MAKQNKDQLKLWFQEGDYPSQQQFYDWFDSFYHKDESLGMSSITGLVQMLQNINNQLANGNGGGALPPVTLTNTNTWHVPALTKIEAYIIIDSVDTVISIGSTAGDADIVDSIACEAGSYEIDRSKFFKDAQDIFFTGITPNTVIIIYRR